jgi:hypothetical protein
MGRQGCRLQKWGSVHGNGHPCHIHQKSCEHRSRKEVVMDCLVATGVQWAVMYRMGYSIKSILVCRG